MRYRAIIAAFLALCLGILTACSEAPGDISKRELTYDDILNTGIANSCLDLPDSSRGSIAIDPDQTYVLRDLCVEPREYFVKQEPLNKRQEAKFVSGKLLTRYTSSLDQIRGDIKANSDGSLTFTEKDGIDFQAATVLLPGGEEVPFLFTIKGLVANTKPDSTVINSSTDFQGKFRVPSYRGQVFLDPKGRSIASGYDNAVALPARADDTDFTRANVKEFVSREGTMSLNVTKVDAETGEIAGVFESEQPSATDLGAEEPEEVKIRGVFYGRVEPAV
ncbi:MAG: photosystem II manganese-stabilizing polypeptide [Xenococcaceae cyanobacterium MO_207.B15]|nr:photosystem II manganese-stabilizing polypeptide [Xenococcaceae cyanobacterium MO_207.B15]MDJ0743226.1 photosystem II manganese-stabilizing polypeptide [Xenococcaceae cyanobacterium MO_167.B27]